jgi:hypothetical protein
LKAKITAVEPDGIAQILLDPVMAIEMAKMPPVQRGRTCGHSSK